MKWVEVNISLIQKLVKKMTGFCMTKILDLAELVYFVFLCASEGIVFEILKETRETHDITEGAQSKINFYRSIIPITIQNTKLSIKDLSSKCDQNCKKTMDLVTFRRI